MGYVEVASVTQFSNRFCYLNFLITNENSAMRYIAENIGMKAILGLNTGLKDEDNEQKVLFYGEK